MSLIETILQRAQSLHVPLSVHFDLTYRCNERCEHCYLDHRDLGELRTERVKEILTDLAEAGVFFLTLSGGEPFLRQDLFEILEHSRSLNFNIKLKTNAVLISPSEAARLRDLFVERVQVSVYSVRAEIHDGITKVRGSLDRTIEGIRALRAARVAVSIANVLMSSNASDFDGVRRLAQELGAQYTLDPTVTPMMDGDASILEHRADADTLRKIFRDPAIVGNVEEFCAPPAAVDDDILDGFSCSAGHTACYISPYGDVFPCVQFPMTCGNLRDRTFREIWDKSPQFAELRSIHARDLHGCSSCGHLGSCSRCPGLAYLEGDMRGPSTADCEKSFLRTGVEVPGLRSRINAPMQGKLVQIQV